MPREYLSDSEVYRDDERISDVRRQQQEAQGPTLGGAVIGTATIALTVLALAAVRHKYILSKGISADVTRLIEGGSESIRGAVASAGYQKFLIPQSSHPWWRMDKTAKNVYETVFKTPLPSVEEFTSIAKLQLAKEHATIAKNLFQEKGAGSGLDKYFDDIASSLKTWTKYDTFFHGPPVAAMAPRALLGVPNRIVTSGGYGSLFVARSGETRLFKRGTGDFYRVISKRRGGSLDLEFMNLSEIIDKSGEGFKVGSIYAAGERIETIKAGFEHIPAKNIKEFAEMLIPDKKEIFREQQRDILETAMLGIHKKSVFPVLEKPRRGASAEDIVENVFKVTGEKDISEMTLSELMRAHDYLAQSNPLHIDSARKILYRSSELARERAKSAYEALHEQVLNNRSTGAKYWLYQQQVRAGIGPMYARKGAGIARSVINKQLNEAGLTAGLIDPFTKRPYRITGPRYELGLLAKGRITGVESRVSKASIGGRWGGVERGQLYGYQGPGTLKRFFIKNFIEGTFIPAFEETFGMGINRAGRNSVGRWVTNTLGVGGGGYAEYAINFAYGAAKLGVAAAGTIYAYNAVNAIVRTMTGGWGPTDVAARTYTAAREFQQQVLANLGIVGAAKEIEKSYPGLVDSPAAVIGLQALVPIAGGLFAGGKIGSKYNAEQLLSSKYKFLQKVGNKIAGSNTKATRNLRSFGASVGLSMGIGLAMLLWGDITQDPEELHRIYTGEQEVPIRKGRWWMFGQCLHPKTLISIGHGCLLKPADEVIAGDTVTNYLGDKTEVVKVVSRAMKEYEIMFDIRTASNRSAGAMVTDNHPLYCVKPYVCPTSLYSYCRPDRNAKNTCHKNTCWKDFKPEWVQAIDVNVGDYLVFPIPNEGQLETLNGIIIDEDLAFIIGHYIAEGNILQTKNNKAYAIELSCSSNEAIMQHDLYASQDGVSSVGIVGNGKNGKKIRVFGVNFTDKIYNLCGTGKNKIIPLEAVGLKRNLLISLLRGYFYGDGGFSNNQPSITSSRMDFLVFVQRAMLILGYTSSIVPHDGVAFGKPYHSYRIILQRSSAFLFKKEGADQIQEYSNVKNVYQFIHDGNLYAKVISKVDTGYNGMVLDFQVKSGESFCGLSFILHNTPFFGGKIQHYRPHWYPLMRSRYKYRGQLWDSEAEELMHSGLIGGALSAVTFGAWDPYYWEKKHYFDRPYPVTGPLFEQNLPFAGVANMSIGGLIKPERYMHQRYLGIGQPGSQRLGFRQIGGSAALGMPDYAPGALTADMTPGSMKWTVTNELYTQAERLGLRGYIINSIVESITGRSDFLPQGTLFESSDRATGSERAYWDRELGDPFGLTEFIRRVLPHRRRQVDAYNPIPNTMPSWLPGEDYFIDFRHGDPYTKIPMGEARLPGAGYESLHELHSGVSGVYDPVDRFMVLAGVAPYSKEYAKYQRLATDITKGDEYWSAKVEEKIRQRAEINKEYEFLDLEEPPAALPLSGAWRQMLNIATRVPNPLEMVPFSPFSTNKWLPYKTAQTTYEDYMLYGSTFQPWSNIPGNFVMPFARKVVGRTASLFGQTYVPGGIARQREYEDYFDRLKYVKSKSLAQAAYQSGQKTLYNRFENDARQTMVGVNAYGSWKDAFYAVPKRERSFYNAFSDAEAGDRSKISALVSPQMRRIYEARWGMSGRGQEDADDHARYFRSHYLPPSDWKGWNPGVDLSDVQLKTVKNEGMDIHAFNLWESQERALQRKPYVPEIENIHQRSNFAEIQRVIEREMDDRGGRNTRTYINATPGSANHLKIRINMRKRSQYTVDNLLADWAGV